MNKDIRMLLEVEGRLGFLSRRRACELVADNAGLTVSGVSGMASRAKKTRAGKIALMTYQATHVAKTPKSASHIAKIIGASLDQLKRRSLTGYAVYIPDPHFPKHSPEALAILYNMVADLPDVVLWTALNDGLDFAKLSVWPDRRALHVQAIEGDIENSLGIYEQHLDIMREVAPDALAVAMIGNHDLRIATVNAVNGLGLYDMYHLMRRLYGRGVLFPASMARENVFEVNESLVWTHGWFASANRHTNAVKNYKQAKMELRARHDFELVFGHTHDQLAVNHINCQIFNAGHMAQPQAEYSRRLLDWRQGFVLSYIKDGGNTTQLVPIVQQGDRLTATNPFNGKTYTERLGSYETID